MRALETECTHRGPVHPHAPEGSVVKAPPIQPTPSRQVEATQHLETWHQGDEAIPTRPSTDRQTS